MELPASRPVPRDSMVRLITDMGQTFVWDVWGGARHALETLLPVNLAILDGFFTIVPVVRPVLQASSHSLH